MRLGFLLFQPLPLDRPTSMQIGDEDDDMDDGIRSPFDLGKILRLLPGFSVRLWVYNILYSI